MLIPPTADDGDKKLLINKDHIVSIKESEYGVSVLTLAVPARYDVPALPQVPSWTGHVAVKPVKVSVLEDLNRIAALVKEGS